MLTHPAPREPYLWSHPADGWRGYRFKGNSMLKYAIVFAIISLIAGAFGFTGVAAGAAGIAKVLFVLFLVLAVLFVVLAVIGVGAARKALK